MKSMKKLVFSFSFFMILFIYKCKAIECLRELNVKLKHRRKQNGKYES